MCARYTKKKVKDASALHDLFRIIKEHAELSASRYNIAPTQQAPVVRVEGGDLRADNFRWGLVPAWAKSPKDMRAPLINARSETVAEKPSFRSAFKKRRCVVPADGFYEWRQDKKTKQPYYIHLPEHRPFVFAGLWEHWESKSDIDGPSIDSFVIITTDANKKIAPLHDRMPVILPDDKIDMWLDPNVEDADALHSLLVPLPDDMVDYYPVGTRVNSYKFDEPGLIEPVTPLGETASLFS